MKYGKKFLINYLYNYLSDKKDPNFELEYTKQIPKKLYRFRSFNENDLSAINNDYIWLSLASEFNDIKDSTIKYNFKSQKEKILDIYFDWYPFILKNELKKKNPKIDLSRLDVNRELIDEYRHSGFNKDGSYNKNKLRNYLLSRGVKGKNFEILNHYLENLLAKENIEREADKLFENFKKKMEELKDYYYVTCFTQTFKNDNLWETYAKKYTGFCIEYDLSRINESEKKRLLFDFAPMVYGNKKPVNFIELFNLAKMEYCEENFDKNLLEDMDVQFNLQARTKSKTYDHEKEWRFYQKKEDFKTRKFHFPYISKIYLGKDIKARNKSRILAIANGNRIEVYQQKYNIITASFIYEKLTI